MMSKSDRDRARPSSGRQAGYALWSRELRRFLRQRSRVIGALGTPVVFWLLLGSGLGDSLRMSEGGAVHYLEFSYAGAIAAVLLFTAIFSMISLIDDRREGFLQGVLVAPVSRAAIVLGKVAGAATLAVMQAAVFLLFAPMAGLRLGPVSILASLAVMTLIAVAVAALSFLIAWRQETTQGFHAIMNLVLMPMLVLSGAFFPVGGSSRWLQVVTAMNPMTYGVTLLRRALYLDTELPRGWSAATGTLAFGVTAGFAVVTCGLSFLAVQREGMRAN